jgi:DNA-directed RNA polymerase subunit alpha
MEPLSLPNQAVIEAVGDNKYKLTLEPLYPGYGVTIGNAIRRVLLSSMPGGAITAVKIKFVDHEFSTIPNVKEDVIQIILNLKQVRLRSTSTEPVRLKLAVKGERVVTAADIEENDQVQIISKNQHIATLDSKNAELDMELIVEQGRGYVPVEARENQKLEIGMLSIDAIYTPVKSVYFDVSNVRVGQITNFDKLEVNIETDGTITGDEAIDISAHILVDHFSMMFTGGAAQSGNIITSDDMTQDEPMAMAPVVEPGQRELDELNLSNRAKNALVKNGIVSVEALEALSNDEINNIAGLGKKTIAEILTALGRE